MNQVWMLTVGQEGRLVAHTPLSPSPSPSCVPTPHSHILQLGKYPPKKTVDEMVVPKAGIPDDTPPPPSILSYQSISGKGGRHARFTLKLI